MSELSEKTSRKPRSIEDEIAKTAAKLKRLQDEQRERIRRDRERNQKEVLELLRSEGLDVIPTEQWKACLEDVKTALAKTGGSDSARHGAAAGSIGAADEGASV